MNFKNIVWFIKAISYFVLLRSLGYYNYYNNYYNNNYNNYYKHKKEWQYPTMLTSHLVNNSYLLWTSLFHAFSELNAAQKQNGGCKREGLSSTALIVSFLFFPLSVFFLCYSPTNQTLVHCYGQFIGFSK